MNENVSSIVQAELMRWSVEDSDDLVIVRTAGRFNVADHRAMVRDIVSRPFWKPSRDAFFDHRALDFDGVGYDVMRGAVENHIAYDAEIGEGRAAVLMGSAADFGRGRIFDGVAKDRIQAHMRIFTDEAAARQWLAEKQEG